MLFHLTPQQLILRCEKEETNQQSMNTSEPKTLDSLYVKKRKKIKFILKIHR